MTELKLRVSEMNKDHNKRLSFRYYLRLVFHLIAVCLFHSVSLYGLYLWILFLKLEEPVDPLLQLVQWFMPLFLTNWNFMFQTVFLTASLIYDIMEWFDKHDSSLGHKLKYYRDVMFSGLVVPMTMFISTMFWAVFSIDRELVFPKVYDQLVPWWFNHCVHTNITIVLLLETLLQSRRHPTNRKLELIINAAVGIGYAIVYYAIYFFAHRWLYGVFGIMTWWQVCLYQLLIWTSTFVFYFIQFPINRIFHKEEIADEKTLPSEKNGETESGISKQRTKIENSSL